MLAPLTSLIGECSQTKVTKAKGTKKVHEVHQRALNHVKATIIKVVFLAYLDYSKIFKIYTDAFVSCKQGTQDVFTVNKLHKCHSMCKTIESVHAAVETQRRIFH